MDKRFIDMVRNRTAELAIGASTLRNQGGPHVVSAARSFLKQLDLQLFGADSPQAFRRVLDQQTARLKAALPPGAQNWGAARKALNIYLRDILYSHYLCGEYGFAGLEEWLELPLDSEAAKGLHSEPEGHALIRWTGVKRLDPKVSESYQDIARQVAARYRTARIHLDLIYWRRASNAQAQSGL
jgi:hypothetical protein